MTSLDQPGTTEETLRVSKNRDDLESIVSIENADQAYIVDSILDVLSHLPDKLVEKMRLQHRMVSTVCMTFAHKPVRQYGFIVGWTENEQFNPLRENHVCTHLDFLLEILDSIESTTGEVLRDEFIENGADLLKVVLDGNHMEVIREIDRSRNVAELLEKSVNLDEVDEADVQLNLVRAVWAYKGLESSQVREIASHIRGRMWAIEQGIHKIVGGLNQFKSAIGDVGLRKRETARSEG